MLHLISDMMNYNDINGKFSSKFERSYHEANDYHQYKAFRSNRSLALSIETV
jgi:hypothetical protein